MSVNNSSNNGLEDSILKAILLLLTLVARSVVTFTIHKVLTFIDKSPIMRRVNKRLNKLIGRSKIS